MEIDPLRSGAQEGARGRSPSDGTHLPERLRVAVLFSPSGDENSSRIRPRQGRWELLAGCRALFRWTSDADRLKTETVEGATKAFDDEYDARGRLTEL